MTQEEVMPTRMGIFLAAPTTLIGAVPAFACSSCLRVWKQPFVQFPLIRFHDKPGRYCHEIPWADIEPSVGSDAISTPGTDDKL